MNRTDALANLNYYKEKLEQQDFSNDSVEIEMFKEDIEMFDFAIKAIEENKEMKSIINKDIALLKTKLALMNIDSI